MCDERARSVEDLGGEWAMEGRGDRMGERGECRGEGEWDRCEEDRGGSCRSNLACAISIDKLPIAITASYVAIIDCSMRAITTS